MTTTPPTAADRFLDLACLSYQGNDGPARREQAARLLAEVPSLVQDSVHAAAAVGDVAAVRALLDADPSRATAPGGPRGWSPLLYLCYSRVLAPDGDALATAKLLLDRGADPNSRTTITDCRFTAMTGAIGEGEGGTVAQPPHAHSRELVILLLDAGADPNDSQALYNTHFRPDDQWLELLTARGLTAAMPTNWDQRSTQPILDWVLGQAARQGFTGRAALLLGKGASAHGRNGYNKRPHLENALLDGHSEIAALLREHGAEPPELSPAQQFRVACLRGDDGEARRLLAERPELGADPAPLLVAAEHGRLPAVKLWCALGLGVNGRDKAGMTALHLAARQGHLAVVQALIAAGARFSARDHVYSGTPLDHTQHNLRTWPTSARRKALAYMLAATTDPYDLFNHEGRARLQELAQADPAVATTQAALLLIERAYAAFNARQIEEALTVMHPDVDWPNGMEGGRVHGHADVRAYWSRQFQTLDPRVDPEHYRADAAGRLVVEVHQVVRDRSGAVLSDQRVRHAYEIEGDLVRRMEILEG